MRAVLFDWVGTLVVCPDSRRWVTLALERCGSREDADDVLEAMEAVDSSGISADGVDASAAAHQAAYLDLFDRAGLDGRLAAAMYEVLGDPAAYPFALECRQTFAALATAGVRIGVLSDIHVDIRPAFAAEGLEPYVDSYTLSFEVGLQKPDPEIFLAAVAALGLPPAEVLMVGDRAAYDGRAVDVGLPTLLLPPLTAVTDRRLDAVVRLCRT